MPRDPSRVLSQLDVENEMLRLSETLEKETHAHADLAEEAAQAEADFKRAWARAYLRAEGTQKTREALADEQTGDELQLHLTKKGLERAKREALYSLRAQLDVLRSISANVRVQT